MHIDKKDWHKCKLCNKNINDLADIFGGSGIYYTEVFIKHLKDNHNISIEEYFEKIYNRPICSCGICNQKVDIKWRGCGNFAWKKYKCGRNTGVKIWSEQAKESRKGKNNPMYNKKPWNKNKTKQDSESLMSVSKKMSGRNISETTKKKQSESAKARIKHGHTGYRHSNESKNKMREATLKRIHNGDIKHTKTKPHIELAKIFSDLDIPFQEEYIIKYWSFDFFLNDFNILIEVDGDYYHSNPIFYTKPKTKTQKINHYRDKKKNEFCESNGYNLIRIWENDIINNKENLICKLKKLFVLDQ